MPTTVALTGMSLSVDDPRIAVEQWTYGRCWFPGLLRFASGELLLNYALHADSHEVFNYNQAVLLSRDAGQTWHTTYDVAYYHNSGGEPRLVTDYGIVGMSTSLKPDPLGQSRVFRAHRWSYYRGGRTCVIRPWDARVTFPRNVAPYVQNERPSRMTWNRVNWYGDILVRLDGSWLSTISLNYGDPLETTEAVVSYDRGRTWTVLSTVAAHNAIPGAFEGFDEAAMVRLADNRILCVSRVGSYQSLWKTYSSDDGLTWSAHEQMNPSSVAPRLLRLANGALVLAVGRGGNSLWFNRAGDGVSWQRFNVTEFHNSKAVAGFASNENNRNPNLIRYFRDLDVGTTGYSAMVEVSPNRVLLAYDYTPFGRGGIEDTGEPHQIVLLALNVTLT